MRATMWAKADFRVLIHEGAARATRSFLLERAGRLTAYLILPVILVTVWQLSVRWGYVKPILLPPPSDIARVFLEMLKTGELPEHLWVSLRRVLEGFAVAAAAGLTLGVAIGLSTKLDRMTDLVFQVTKPIPPISWIPMAILWFGIGEMSKIFIIFLGAFFPVLVNTVDGVRQTDKRYVELARVLEVSRKRLILQVILPGALPSIMTGIRVGLMVAWICVVAAELIAASSGVGFMIMNGRLSSQTDQVLLGMLMIGVMGKLLDTLLKRIESRMIPWRGVYKGD
jgi:sulfonate transport system permease protein